jgi:hypothetical protein
MSSKSLENLKVGLAEVSALKAVGTISASRPAKETRPQLLRALGRAQVVLLSAHLERYVYSVTEESVDHIFNSRIESQLLSEELRLIHSQDAIDKLGRTQWNNRSQQLKEFGQHESKLWVDGAVIDRLVPEQLLGWMKAPNPKNLTRAFQIWGTADIFDSITRTAVTRSRLWMRINELVEKRNNIAHGDFTVEAQPTDVTEYILAVRRFCERSDRTMARNLVGITGGMSPW